VQEFHAGDSGCRLKRAELFDFGARQNSGDTRLHLVAGTNRGNGEGCSLVIRTLAPARQAGGNEREFCGGGPIAALATDDNLYWLASLLREVDREKQRVDVFTGNKTVNRLDGIAHAESGFRRIESLRMPRTGPIAIQKPSDRTFCG